MNGERSLSLEIDGRAVPLRLRRNPRAKHLILRIDTETRGAVVTLPRRASLEEGLELARRKSNWIALNLDALPHRTPFAEGEVVPLLDVFHRIVHDAGKGPPVRAENGEIVVTGRREHLTRRLSDWLRKEARRHIEPSAGLKAAQLDCTVGRVSIRDTRSRWGSCASNGNLSFCWRLVMAPPEVLDYVVAHEVAHLKHMNHGPNFWRAVNELTNDAKTSRAWLRKHGPALRRYG